MRTFAQKPKVTQQTASAKSTGPRRAHFGQSHGVSRILHLQRMIGNHAVMRLIEADTKDRKRDPTATSIPPVGHDFSKAPLFAQYKEASTVSLFEDEKAQPEDAEDVVGLSIPASATHNAVVGLRKRYGLGAPHRTLVYGFTAWSPKRSATFPKLNITWKKVGRKWTGIVKPTKAAMGTVEALYVRPGTYLIPGVTRLAPNGKKVPVYSQVDKTMSQLARTAEQEHCDDYQRAFDLSLEKYANLINAIAGKTLGPDSRSAIKRSILKKIGGKTLRQWVKELNRLTRLSLKRDISDHRLKPDGNPRTCPNNCTKLVYTTVKSPTTKIPGPSSRDLIK